LFSSCEGSLRTQLQRRERREEWTINRVGPPGPSATPNCTRKEPSQEENNPTDDGRGGVALLTVMFRRKKKETQLQKGHREDAEYQRQLESIRKTKTAIPDNRKSNRAPPDDSVSATRPPTGFAAPRQSKRRNGAQTLPGKAAPRPLPAPPPGSSTSTMPSTEQDIVYSSIDQPGGPAGGAVPAAAGGEEVLYGEIDFGRGPEPAPASGQVIYGDVGPPAAAPASGEVVYGSSDPAPQSGEVIYGATPDSGPAESQSVDAHALYAAPKTKRRDGGAAAAGGADAAPLPGTELYAEIKPRRRGSRSTTPDEVVSAAQEPAVPPMPPKTVHRSAVHQSAAGADLVVEAVPQPVSRSMPSPRQKHVDAVDRDAYSLPSSIGVGGKSEDRAVEAWLDVPLDRMQAQKCLEKAGLKNGAYLVRKSSGDTCVV